MDQSQILRAFCDHFQEFIDDVLRVFPRDTELRAVGKALGLMRKMNPRIIPTVFHKTIGKPYAAEIAAGDPTFFIEKNWADDVSDSKDGTVSKQGVLDKIERMRGSLRHMNPSDLAKSVQYIRNLARLAELYCTAKSS